MSTQSVLEGARLLLRSLIGITAAIVLGGVGLIASAAPDGASAKTPGKTYCFNRVCHRVLTLAETRRQIGGRRSVLASYYNSCHVDRFNPCGLTSSGAVFRPNRADNAASPIYPNGTKLLVWNPRNKRAAVVRIDNAGPYYGRRTLDLSRAAADRLAIRGSGVARLTVQVISAPTASEARYRRNRVYAPVRGYIGQFASLASAAAAGGGTTRPGAQVRLADASAAIPAAVRRRQSKAASPTSPRRQPVRRRLASRRLPAAIVIEEERTLPGTKRSRARRVAAVERRARRTSQRASDRDPVIEKAIAAIEAEERRSRRSYETRRSAERAPRSRNIRQRSGQVNTAASPTRTATPRQRRAAPSGPAPINRAIATVRANSARAAVPTAAVAARPNMKWRSKFLVINLGGA